MHIKNSPPAPFWPLSTQKYKLKIGIILIGLMSSVCMCTKIRHISTIFSSGMSFVVSYQSIFTSVVSANASYYTKTIYRILISIQFNCKYWRPLLAKLFNYIRNSTNYFIVLLLSLNCLNPIHVVGKNESSSSASGRITSPFNWYVAI